MIQRRTRNVAFAHCAAGLRPLMTYFAAYISILVVFGAIDAGWLRIMGHVLYRPVLGDILLPDLRLAPAIAFYLLYPIGILVFAVIPALRSGSALNACLYAVLFGALAYATYDLTNYATLRNWTLQITIIDICYGALAAGIAATAAYFVAHAFSP
ncbi:MAG: DUF2177 family protein [Xanthobacteraceae bacterium]